MKPTMDDLMAFQIEVAELIKSWGWGGAEVPNIFVLLLSYPDDENEKGKILGQANTTCAHCLVEIVKATQCWAESILDGSIGPGAEDHVKH